MRLDTKSSELSTTLGDMQMAWDGVLEGINTTGIIMSRVSSDALLRRCLPPSHLDIAPLAWWF